MDDGFVEFGDRTAARIKRDLQRSGWAVTRAKPRSGIFIARKGEWTARGWDMWELAVNASNLEWGAAA